MGTSSGCVATTSYPIFLFSFFRGSCAYVHISFATWLIFFFLFSFAIFTFGEKVQTMFHKTKFKTKKWAYLKIGIYLCLFLGRPEVAKLVEPAEGNGRFVFAPQLRPVRLASLLLSCCARIFLRNCRPKNRHSPIPGTMVVYAYF